MATNGVNESITCAKPKQVLAFVGAVNYDGLSYDTGDESPHKTGINMKCLRSNQRSRTSSLCDQASDTEVVHTISADTIADRNAVVPSERPAIARHLKAGPQAPGNTQQPPHSSLDEVYAALPRPRTLVESVLHILMASLLLRCTALVLALRAGMARLAVLRCVLVLTSRTALLVWGHWLRTTSGLSCRSGEPSAVNGERAGSGSFEPSRCTRLLSVFLSDATNSGSTKVKIYATQSTVRFTAVILLSGVQSNGKFACPVVYTILPTCCLQAVTQLAAMLCTSLRSDEECARRCRTPPALCGVWLLTVLFGLSGIPAAYARTDVNLATWTKPGQGLEVWGGNGDLLGYSVAGVGDVNHDGYDDIVIGALYADYGGRTNTGAAFIVFGSPSRSTGVVDAVNTLAPKGIRISGAVSGDYWGQAVNRAGDFNKDGIDDLIISGTGYNNPFTGAAVVIFGKTSGWVDIDLASFTSGTAGFWILGAAVGDNGGSSVSAAGDVNGDGVDDLIVSSITADSQSKIDSGASYVIFGHSTGTFNTIALATFSSGSSGFKIYGAAAGDFSGYQVSGAGDMNGDGYSDVIISAIYYDRSGGTDCGAVYVIFGHNTTTAFTNIDLAALSSNRGFRITGAAANDRLGYSLCSAGDFNHDGYSDVVIGSQANKTYVLLGHSNAATFSNVDLSAFTAGSAGFVVSGGGGFGSSVGGGADVNGDGIHDIVVAAPLYSATGVVYVLYGRPQAQLVNFNVLTGLTSVRGFRIVGASSMGGGWWVSTVSDFDGDGLGEIVVGARGADFSGRTDAGAVYLIYGELSAPTSQPSRQPTRQPSRQPTMQPSFQPASQPTAQPSRQPTGQPTRQPTSQPSRQPSARPTSSPVSERSGDVNLATWSKPGQGLEVWGALAGDAAGFSVADAGDVNKDGYRDVLIGAPFADLTGKEDAGAAYLVFGSPSRSTSTVDTASSILPKGIKVLGASAYDHWGWSVSGAGDFNKDGIDDFIVSGTVHDPHSRVDCGAALVIFGKTSGWADINLASFTSGSAGFWIWGGANSDYLGSAVGDAGDVNGDGAGDLIVGASHADPQSKLDSGATYVIFGHSTATAFATIDTASFTSGSAGFKIYGATVGDTNGEKVSGVGDLNGDGYDDIVTAAVLYDGTGGIDCGAAYVIFGHSTATAFTDIDLAALPSNQGFRVTGTAANAQLGWSVSTAGDFNHDGYDDIVFGSLAGSAFVLFGHTGTFANIDLSTFTACTAGFKVMGGAYLGYGVSGGADINKDGVDDIVITAPSVAPNGVAYVLYGHALLQYVDINVQTGLPAVIGFTIVGASTSMIYDWPVSVVRDFDGDGVADIVIGAHLGDPPGRADAGTAYMIYGELSAPTSQPSRQPSGQPSAQPISLPSRQPTSQPSRQPTSLPSCQPSSRPSRQPSSCPTGQPSRQPSAQPSMQPSRHPSSQPSRQPAGVPTSQPTRQPSDRPSTQPSGLPTGLPTAQPSSQPSKQPSAQPGASPSGQPSRQPTRQPSSQPSTQPTSQPTKQPSGRPSAQPSRQPTAAPTARPSSQPSGQPSGQPVAGPSGQPSGQPSTVPSAQPSVQPTRQPSDRPSTQPSGLPTGLPTAQPSSQPSKQPSAQPGASPSGQPSRQPTRQPSSQPSTQPTSQPTKQPSGRPSAQPSRQPTAAPTARPSSQPSGQPSGQPVAGPSGQPSGQPSTVPSAQPSVQPTGQPSRTPTQQPSSQPTAEPSRQPTLQPVSALTSQPASQPSAQPSGQPTGQPSCAPSGQPSRQPTQHPSATPTAQPSSQPTTQPSNIPSSQPFSQPSTQPTSQPASCPSNVPSCQPSGTPSSQPTSLPTSLPTAQPSQQPSPVPSTQPSQGPSGQPSSAPTLQPTSCPSAQPSQQPTLQPSTLPSSQPSGSPSLQPTSHPSAQPSRRPSAQPSYSPSSQPTLQPTAQHSFAPSNQPSAVPTAQPTARPTTQPSALPANSRRAGHPFSRRLLLL
jgi:hypothetical protein